MNYKKAYTIGNQRECVGVRDVGENPRRQGDYPHAPNEIIDCDALSEYGEYEIPVLNPDNKTWVIKKDYRNIDFYNFDGSKANDYKITEIGIEPDLSKYSFEAPDFAVLGSFIKRDTISNKWIVDEARKAAEDKQNRIGELEDELRKLDLKRSRPNADILLGIDIDFAKEKLQEIETLRTSLAAELNELTESGVAGD